MCRKIAILNAMTMENAKDNNSQAAVALVLP